MSRYYDERLSAQRLRRCYEIAPPRVRRYFDAEFRFVADRIRPSDEVLELGCGYGRFIGSLAGKARLLVGIDTSTASLLMGRELSGGTAACRFLQMDALALAFRDRTFDVVLCIQNGLSAFHVDPRTVISESIRVGRRGGRVLLSSYSPRFWPDRLEWFRLQAAEGLLGKIDEQATGNGVIVCSDGFHARTIGGDEFLSLTSGFDVQSVVVQEVDESSVFCEITV